MITVCMPEPHILFTVVQVVARVSPAFNAACRAGAWPWPAGNTQPISTSCTFSAGSPLRSTVARMAAAPSCQAVMPCRSP